MEDDTPEYTDTKALLLLLNDFRERRESFSVFSDYDKSMVGIRETYRPRIESLDSPLKPIAKELFEIADQSFFLLQVVEWKIDYLAEGLFQAIQSKNPLSLANNARALVEHVASIAGICSEIGRLENTLHGQQSEKIIKEAIGRAKSYLQRAYYGRSPKASGKQEPKSIHINDSLKALSKKVKNIEEIYDFLCEYVHPNFGSNLLVSTGELANGRLNPPEEYHRETLDQLRRICSYCMIYLKEQATEHLSSPIRIQALIDLCLVRGAKLQNVFAVKAAQPIGDGKSKATAYYFPKARTSQEAIQLTYQFFESEGYKWVSQEVGGVEDGYIYDIHNTNKGRVWVKVPMLDM